MRSLLVIAIALVGVACNTDLSPAPRAKQTQPKRTAPSSADRNAASSEQALEYKLAVVDRGGYVAPDDMRVARFRSLLEQLSTKYVEKPQEIADMSVMLQNLLREKGISETMQNMMEGLNQVMDQPIGNQKFAEYGAMYVQLRDSGRSHTEAISTIRGALRELGVR
jgi:hypothetical protein